MKTWKKGAIVGGAIGLLKISASILFPIAGAAIGAVLVQSTYTFVTTTKIKLWQKAGIAGAVWGLTSGVIFLIEAYVQAYTGISGVKIPLKFKILFLPAYLWNTFAFTVLKTLYPSPMEAAGIIFPMILLLSIFCPILIGGLMGVVFAKIINVIMGGKR